MDLCDDGGESPDTARSRQAEHPNKYQPLKQDLVLWNVFCSVGGFFSCSFPFVLLSIYFVLFFFLYSIQVFIYFVFPSCCFFTSICYSPIISSLAILLFLFHPLCIAARPVRFLPFNLAR
jgi:hypothetical protein